MLLVEREEAPASIVYATNAAAVKGVTVAGIFPDNSHDPITYPFAATKAGDILEPPAFLAFLNTTATREVWTRRGFKLE